MRKTTLTLLGLFSALGIFVLIKGSIDMLLTGDNDVFELGWFLIPPAVFSTYLFIKMLKDVKYYEKYKLVGKIAVFGILITLLLSILLTVYIGVKQYDALSIIVVIFIFGIGMGLTFVASFISWLVIHFKEL